MAIRWHLRPSSRRSSDSAVNATQLFHQDGTPAGVWYCGKCRYARREEDEAERCCQPHTCPCGAEAPQGWTICSDCERTKRAVHERAVSDAAGKCGIDDYKGEIVFVDDWDSYLDLDELDDRIADSIAEFIELGGRPWEWEPPRVYATTARRPMINIGEAIESALEDSYDGARDAILSSAESDLAEFVDMWSSKNMPVVYYSNPKIAIVPWTQ